MSSLELVVVTAIVAVLTAISVPAAREMNRRIRVRTVSKRLEAELVELRESAVLLGRRTVLRIGAGRYWAEASDGRLLSAEQSVPNGIQVEARCGSGIIGSVSAFASGVMSPCRITVSTSDRTCALVVSLRGRIRETCG